MAFSEIELRRIEKTVGALCKRRSPPEFRDELSFEYKVAGNEVLIFELRPQWDNRENLIEQPVAKLRFVATTKIWHLYWQRANMRWVGYEPSPADKDIAVLVDAIDRDEYGCFFG
jgi:hypothetical protein